MAEDGNVPGRKTNVDEIEKDSVDECYLACCECMKKNIKIEADYYCTVCLDYFCSECVKKTHGKESAGAGHVLFASEDFKKQNISQAKLPSIPTKRCSDHATKIIDMYCKTHGEVGCSACFNLKHSRYVFYHLR